MTLLLPSLVAPAAHAQALRGVVVEDSLSTPVAGAQVSLLDPGGGVAYAGVADSAGRFLLAVRPGQYSLRVVRVGFAPVLTRRFSIGEGADTVSVTVILPPAESAERVYPLAPVVVEGEAAHPFLAGFERRRAAGLGDFVTRDEFEEWNPTTVTDIVRRMPSFVARANPTYMRELPDGTLDTRRFLLEVATRSQQCPVVIFLDGVRFAASPVVDVDILPIDAIEAVETYSRPADVPVEFSGSGADCGVIAFWTRVAAGSETASPFELGVRYGGRMANGSYTQGRIGFHLIVPLFGSLELYPALNVIVSGEEDEDSGWQAQLAVRLRPFTDGPWYVGTGLGLYKPKRSFQNIAQGEADLRASHMVLSGLAVRLGPTRPFLEVDVLDLHRFSDAEWQVVWGLGIQL